MYNRYQARRFAIGLLSLGCVVRLAAQSSDDGFNPSPNGAVYAVHKAQNGLITIAGNGRIKHSALNYRNLSPANLPNAGATDVLAADFDGDSRADLAVRNIITQAWTILLSSGGYAPVSFDLPF